MSYHGIKKQEFNCRNHFKNSSFEYVEYCLDCKKNLCHFCIEEHENHNRRKFKIKPKEEKDLKLYENDEVREKVKEFEKEKKKLLNIFDNIKNKVKQLFDDINKKAKSYDFKYKRNYETVCNVNDAMNFNSKENLIYVLTTCLGKIPSLFPNNDKIYNIEKSNTFSIIENNNNLKKYRKELTIETFNIDLIIDSKINNINNYCNINFNKFIQQENVHNFVINSFLNEEPKNRKNKICHLNDIPIINIINHADENEEIRNNNEAIFNNNNRCENNNRNMNYDNDSIGQGSIASNLGQYGSDYRNNNQNENYNHSQENMPENDMYDEDENSKVMKHDEIKNVNKENPDESHMMYDSQENVLNSISPNISFHLGCNPNVKNIFLNEKNNDNENTTQVKKTIYRFNNNNSNENEESDSNVNNFYDNSCNDSRFNRQYNDLQNENNRIKQSNNNRNNNKNFLEIKFNNKRIIDKNNDNSYQNINDNDIHNNNDNDIHNNNENEDEDDNNIMNQNDNGYNDGDKDNDNNSHFNSSSIFKENKEININDNIRNNLNNNVNDQQIQEGNNNKENNNVILLTYEREKSVHYIKIFGQIFVENNKDNCYIKINNKEKQELTERINISNDNIINNCLNIKLVINSPLNMSKMFCECPCLVSVSKGFSFLNLKNTKEMDYMFYNCYSLKSLPDLSKWDTKKVVNMTHMFDGCKNLKSMPDIQVKMVENISFFFCNCSSLESLPNISIWDTSNIKVINNLFENCSKLTGIPDISKWETSKCKNMACLFKGCLSLKELPDLSNWNISNATDLSHIFEGCQSLETLPDLSNWDISSVTNLSGVFKNCRALKNLPDISRWSTGKVIDMSYLFFGCESIKKIPSLKNWLLKSLIDISHIAARNSNLDPTFYSMIELNIPNKKKNGEFKNFPVFFDKNKII